MGSTASTFHTLKALNRPFELGLQLPTPPAAVADFCLIPIGTPTASVSNEVAAVQRLMKASGLSYSMHSAGTTVGMLIFNRSSTPLRLSLNMISVNTRSLQFHFN